jgi:hypothetical protein
MSTETTNQTEANRETIREAFESWKNGTGSITEVFAPEMVWRIEGHSAASRQYESRQQFLDEVAVVEGGPVDDLAVAHLQKPGVAVLVGLPVVGGPPALPEHDHGVAVGVHRPDRDRTEGIRGSGEPGAEGRERSCAWREKACARGGRAGRLFRRAFPKRVSKRALRGQSGNGRRPLAGKKQPHPLVGAGLSRSPLRLGR